MKKSKQPLLRERYVVAVHEADPGSPETFLRYVGALAHAAYSNKEGRRYLVGNRDEAFIFSTLAAAEMTAVWVGGEVETIL